MGQPLSSRLQYLVRSGGAWATGRGRACPNCGAIGGDVVDRKMLVTQLRRCPDCALLFRTPTDPVTANRRFYNSEYRGYGIPDDARLEELRRSNFRSDKKDFSYHIGLMAQIGVPEGGRVFDFGCQWGYASFQFLNAGYRATGFDIAEVPRRVASEKLGVPTVGDMEAAIADPEHRGRYDCFFSAHVIEHLPKPSAIARYAQALLREGGLFLCLMPNGSEAHRQAGSSWSTLWGHVHPNYIDDRFLDRLFPNSPRAFTSSPAPADFHLPEAAERRDAGTLEGHELVFAARKQGETW